MSKSSPKTDSRTAGERSRDLRISVICKKLELLKIKVKQFEDSSHSSRDYTNAERFQKLGRMITEMITEEE